MHKIYNEITPATMLQLFQKVSHQYPTFQQRSQISATRHLKEVLLNLNTELQREEC